MGNLRGVILKRLETFLASRAGAVYWETENTQLSMTVLTEYRAIATKDGRPIEVRLEVRVSGNYQRLAYDLGVGREVS